MNITVNGKEREIDGETTVVALLQTLNVNAKQVAVAINGEVVRRGDWPETNVHAGDTVEIVRAVGGG